MAAMEFASLALRQVAEAEGSVPKCGGGNEYDGKMGLRISAVFVILVGSMFGLFCAP